MNTIEVIPGRPLVGRIRVPGDKSISHRALLLAALAEGTSRITGLSNGDDVVRTAAAVAALGASITAEGGATVVEGGRSRLREATAPLDLGNSGTGMRLLAGWAATLDGLTVLTGDQWLARRPMDRVVAPLRQMGVRIDGREGGRLPPLVVRGGAVHGIEYDLPVASAQVKAAVLLAGLAADRPSVVREPAPVRAHTEEMLADFGADVSVSADGAVVTIRPSALRPCDVAVPGDPSQAAYWVVAGCVVPDSDVMVEDVYVGRARAGFLDVLRRMGADITVVARTATTADIRARFAPLHATTVGGTEVPGLIDEIPVLAVAAACADGTTEFTDASELTVKETNRVATVTAALGALGVGVEPRADGLSVRGGGALHGGEVDSSGDHRVAMAGAIAALVADAPTRVRGWDAVATSYPGFVDDLERLQR